MDVLRLLTFKFKKLKRKEIEKLFNFKMDKRVNGKIANKIQSKLKDVFESKLENWRKNSTMKFNVKIRSNFWYYQCSDKDLFKHWKRYRFQSDTDLG